MCDARPLLKCARYELFELSIYVFFRLGFVAQVTYYCFGVFGMMYQLSDPLVFIGLFFTVVFLGFGVVMYFMSGAKKSSRQNYSSAFIQFSKSVKNKSD